MGDDFTGRLFGLLDVDRKDRASALSTEPIGSFSSGYGGGYKKDDCEGISLALLLTTFLAIGALFFALFTKLTMIGRRKRSLADAAAEEGTNDPWRDLIVDLHLIIYGGLR